MMIDQKTIQEDIESNPVILFMKGSKTFPQCGFSSRVVEILKSCQIPFVTRDVLESDELRQGIKEYSNWPTIPQLYIKGEFIGGCDIVTEMFQNGELQKVLSDSLDQE